MAGVLKSQVATYEFSLDDMKALIAADLGKPASQIEVEYVIQEVGGDPLDRFPGRGQVTKVRVTVKEATPAVAKSYSPNRCDLLNYGCDERRSWKL